MTSIPIPASTAFGPPTNSLVRPPVLVTWRVVIRDTGAALRRGFESSPRFGQPQLFPDQIAEFPTRDAAECAIHDVRSGGRFNEAIALESRETVHAGIDGARLNAVLCRVRDTVVEHGWADMNLTHPTLRGLVALAPLSTKGGW